MTNRRDFIVRALEGALLAACGGCAWRSGAPKRKFALNASTLRGYRLPLLEQVKAAVAAGFAGFEPWLADVHAAKKAGQLDAVVDAAGEGGLEFVNGIAFGRWVDPDQAIRAAGLDETRRDMELLREIGCPRIAASMFGVQKYGAPVLSKVEIAERFAAVLSLGDELGVKPLLEYWGHSANLFRLEDALQVLSLVERDDTAVLADVYHTYRGGGSFETFRRLSRARLPVLHVNDYPASIRREELADPDRVWPGDGAAPWTEIFANLSACGADPWLSIEVFNPAYWKTNATDTAYTGYRRLAAVAR